jgi:hypothetical protein
MAVMRDPSGNLFQAQAEWLLANGRPGDIVVSYDKEKFTRYLRYNSRLDIVNLLVTRPADVPAVRDKLDHAPGAVYVMQSVLDPPRYACLYSRDGCALVHAFVASLGRPLELVSDSPTGKVYALRSVG